MDRALRWIYAFAWLTAVVWAAWLFSTVGSIWTQYGIMLKERARLERMMEQAPPEKF